MRGSEVASREELGGEMVMNDEKRKTVKCKKNKVMGSLTVIG